MFDGKGACLINQCVVELFGERKQSLCFSQIDKSMNLENRTNESVKMRTDMLRLQEDGSWYARIERGANIFGKVVKIRMPVRISDQMLFYQNIGMVDIQNASG